MAGSDKLLDEAKTLRQQGRLGDAVARYRRAAALDPQDPEGFFGWASIAYERGNLKNAEKLAQSALKIDPAHAAANNLLGSIYMRQGWYGWAEPCFRKAIARDPAYVPAYSNLALVLLASDPALAEAAARDGLSRDENFAPLHRALAQTLAAQGRGGEAIALLEQAVKKFPEDHATLFDNLGVLHLNLGDSARAARYLRRAIKADPGNVNAHYTLSGVHKYKPGDPHIGELQALLESLAPLAPQAGWVHFALGKAWEDCGDADRAFHHYAQGNFIIRVGFSYKSETAGKEFAAIKKFYRGDIARHALPVRANDPTPIFIVGMPRSGTTLAEQILFSHPEVAAAGEVGYLPLVYSKYIREALIGAGDIARVPAEALRQARDEYLEKLRRHGGGARFITDKMPTNFFHIGLIRLLFPQAKIIHCRREPMDNCFSMYKCVFTGRFPFAYDLKELGVYYNHYADLMMYWHERLPGYIHDLQYEDLVAEQEAVTRQILSFCGLKWDAACLRFHASERAVMTASALQVRRPLYKKGIGSWRKYEKHLSLLRKELN